MDTSNKITVKDKKFTVSINADEIQKSVKRVADEINRDYQGKEILFVGVLNGVFMFASDLMKNIKVPCTISFMKVSSYEGTSSTGKIKNLIGIQTDKIFDFTSRRSTFVRRNFHKTDSARNFDVFH